MLLKPANGSVERFPLPCQGGGGRAVQKSPHSEKARTGWSITSYVLQCVFLTFRLIDHPGCGAVVASRLLLMPQPPLFGKEGKTLD